jgi:mannonate dehydratase
MGVEGVVTSLHHLKPGVTWSIDEIKVVRDEIEREGLRWSVVESLPVSEDIKLGNEKRTAHIENYKQSIVNLAECGVKTICYNFMPVLDWVRTDLAYMDGDGTETMLYDHVTFAVFDLFLLERENASGDYPDSICKAAQKMFDSMNEREREQLAHTIVIVTQGFIYSAVEESGDYMERFRRSLEQYKGMDVATYRENLRYFLDEVAPVAEEQGVRLCIHPDDPPFPVLGLPRIASTLDDFQWIFSRNDSLANGLTLCTGSLAARRGSDVLWFVEAFGERIHFAHLRNLRHLDENRFYESGHLDGNIDICSVVEALLREQYRRLAEGRNDARIPFRSDHGKKMVDDFQRKANPGYPLAGRLRGLSEIHGLQTAINRMLGKRES